MLSVLFSNSVLFIEEMCSAVFTVTQMIVECHAEVIGAHLNLVLKFSDLFEGETERWQSHNHIVTMNPTIFNLLSPYRTNSPE